MILGPQDGRSRILHTMVRVRDMDASLRFYVEGLGLSVLDRLDDDAARTTTAWVGFEGADAGAVVELTRPWDDHDPYTHGSGYGHVAVGATDIAPIFARVEAMGAEVLLRPGKVVEGGPFCAFVRDPDGYAVELVQTRGQD